VDWRGLLCGSVLAVAAIAVYSRTFSVPPLFDDDDAIVNNLTIRHWSTALLPAINTTATGRPILNLSLAFNYAIGGTAMWSYHAVNLAIHILAGLTLFGIVRRTLRLCSGQALRLCSGQALRLCSGQALRLCSGQALRLRSGRALAGWMDGDAVLIGFSAALLWTLHPLQTEAVTYVIQRAESLMGLFYLLTVYCFIRAVGADVSGPLAGRAPSERNPRLRWNQGHFQTIGDSGGFPNVAKAADAENDRSASWIWFALCVCACLLGMGTKEVMVSAPLIVLLYDRTFVAGSFREAWRQRWRMHAALAATWLPLAGLVAGSGWDRNGASGFDVGIRPWAYWLTQFEAVSRYLWLSVWPHPLVFEYGTFWVKNAAEVAPCALVLVGLAVAVLVALWRWPALGFLGAWFFVILAPTSLMPGRVQMIVEHRMYLPLAAVIVAAVAGLHAVMQRPRDNGPQDHGPQDHGPVALGSCGSVVRGPVVFVVLLLALGLGLLTARRNEDYRSELAIWSDTVAKRPDNERARNNLGLAWSKMPGRLDDAVAQYEAALRLNPDYPEAHNNLGIAWAQMPGRLNDAIAEFQEALRLQPDSAEAHTDLGGALLKIPGRLSDAIAQLEEAVRVKPDYAEAHTNLGLAWAQMPGGLSAAIAEFEEALRLQPDDAEAHNNLGVALAEMPERLDAAIAHYEAALRLNPDYPEAHNNLGIALAQMPGRLNDAVAQFEAALRLNQDYASAWHNLGTSQLNSGNLPAAAAAFREELRLKPGDTSAQQALAAATRRAGVR